MDRRNFIRNSSGLALVSVAGAVGCKEKGEPGRESVKANPLPYPLAITMWEFSWLERRWPGAGYEDWDQALSELVTRGYDAVRIDAFPHLIYHDPHKEYLLLPHWHTQDWGSPEINRVTVQPNLNEFIKKCASYNVRVGLSSWFRQDEEDVRMHLDTPEKLGEAWLKVLHSIDEAGLIDSILYVDLCNEWTGPAWCPFFVNDPPEATWGGWDTKKSQDWMTRSIALLKTAFPDIPYTFSFTGEVTDKTAEKGVLTMLDFLEPHIWMTSFNNGEFYNLAGYGYERYDYSGYRNMALKGRKTYYERKDHWDGGLTEQIRHAAEWSRALNQPLITTECWGVVDYKDWPLLDWDYVKELCALGTEVAAKTGQWLAIGTSNFCGPQFLGMWRDVEWHRRLTGIIHTAGVSEAMKNSKLALRMQHINKA